LSKTYESNLRGNPPGLPSCLACFRLSTGADIMRVAF
jgi:hypothetical protein